MIYLDHLASTPLDPAARDAMAPWLTADAVGNPHSAHRAGWRAAQAVEDAKAGVAALIGARPGEIVLTSGATEANALALYGVGRQIGRVVVSAVEHPAVLEPALALREGAVEVTVLPVDAEGRIDLDDLKAALAPGPALVSIMAANNEIGTLAPLAEIGALCRAGGAVFHTDATQALSTQPVDVGALGIDLLSLSGHKLYGPMGIGALYVRAGQPLVPHLLGGGQQDGKRAGTVPVALAAGLGAACRDAHVRCGADAARLARLCDRLWERLVALIGFVVRVSPVQDVLPGCLNVRLPGADAAALLLEMPELAISTGAACAEMSGKPSHVLRAIGLSAEEAHSTLRFGIGRHTREAEIDAAVAMLHAALQKTGTAAR